MDCEGYWVEVAGAQDGDEDVAVSRCSDCGDWLVIIAYRGFDVAAADAATAADAVRQAFAQRFAA